MVKSRKSRVKSAVSRRKVVGISNRQTPAEEAQGRHEFPPINPESPPPEDAGGSIGELGSSRSGRQTSHKAGSRSVEQKMARSKYADRSTPASRKVAGAFAQETTRPLPRDRKGTSHPARARNAPPGARTS